MHRIVENICCNIREVVAVPVNHFGTAYIWMTCRYVKMMSDFLRAQTYTVYALGHVHVRSIITLIISVLKYD